MYVNNELTSMYYWSYSGAEGCPDLKLGNKIAELVLITGDTINIADAYQDPRFDPEVLSHVLLQMPTTRNYTVLMNEL